MKAVQKHYIDKIDGIEHFTQIHETITNRYLTKNELYALYAAIDVITAKIAKKCYPVIEHFADGTVTITFKAIEQEQWVG